MTFEEAGREYATLRQQRDLGQMTEAQYRQAVSQLMVVDPQGYTWSLNPDSAQWMMYNGAEWVTQAAAAQVQQAAEPSQSARPAETANPAGGQPLTSWGERTWDVLSVVGSAAMSAAWYWYSGMAETQADVKTCVAMLVLPVLLIVFRSPLDKLLRPLDKFRSKVPPMVLAGVGVAVPFLVANYLYSSGVSQFPFMFKTYVYSTLLSYVILRTPYGGRMVAPSGVSPQQGAA